MPTNQGPDLTIAAIKLTTQPLNNNQINGRTPDIEAQGKDHEIDSSSVQTPSISHTVLAVAAIQTNQHISQSGLPSSHLSAVASRPIQSVVTGRIMTTGKHLLADAGDEPQLRKKARLSEKQPPSSALINNLLTRLRAVHVVHSQQPSSGLSAAPAMLSRKAHAVSGE